MFLPKSQRPFNLPQPFQELNILLSISAAAFCNLKDYSHKLWTADCVAAVFQASHCA
jgi:hypothetical protein